jgi:transcription antitermination factor NusG
MVVSVRNTATAEWGRSLQGHRRWYAAASQPGREDIAQLNLRRQGFVSWLPRQRRMVRHARRTIEKNVAFFPGYLFVSLDLATDRWRPINGTVGVRSLIMQGDSPLACPVGLIENMQDASDADGLVNEQAGLVEGGVVRVLVGPFAEMVGTLSRLEGASRARVLLALMQSQVAVQMDVRDLTPLT